MGCLRALGDYVLLRATDQTLENGLVLKTAFVVEDVGETVPASIQLNLGDAILYNEEKAVPLDARTICVHYKDLYAIAVQDIYYNNDNSSYGLEV